MTKTDLLGCPRCLERRSLLIGHCPDLPGTWVIQCAKTYFKNGTMCGCGYVGPKARSEGEAMRLWNEDQWMPYD